jgi:serine/threonine protein kinase
MPEPLEAHSSDIQTAISRLHVKNTLIGYRNLLSYASALNVHIFKTEKINRHLWVSKASGTYSEVFETRLECEPPNEVVIKVPNASFTRDDEAVENLVQHQALSNIVREVRILTHQNLSNHDNLIRIFGIYLEEEDNPVGTRPCIVFEKAFETLSAYLKNSSVRVSEKSVVTFSADVAAGLSAIHAHGLVHGDLKPENVLMVLRHGRITCVLADFGTCGTSGQSEVEHGIIPGTPGFRAPEYYTSSCFHPWVNKPTRDVYGLGLIVFSIITNDSAPPFSSNSEKLQHDDVACLEYLRRCSFQNSATDLPWDIIQLCIRANPEERSSLALINSILRRAQGQHG